MLRHAGGIGRIQARRLPTVLLVLLMLASATGCGPRTVPLPINPPAPPSTPPTPSASTPPPAPPPSSRPAPWAGAGLAEPYITPEGNLELTFADARGTVTVNAKGTKVAAAALSPGRLQLAYALATDTLAASPVYIIDATASPWRQRELRSASTDFIGELDWSPCGRYLAVDSGTSVVRALAVVDVATDTLAAVLTTCGSTWAWTPVGPTRLAAIRVSRLPIVPITELMESADLVVVDLPSGRTSVVAAGTVAAVWDRPKWLSGGRLQARLTPLGDPERVTTAEFAAPPVKAGPIPPVDVSSLVGGGVNAEISALGELLLVNAEGAVVRRLTDRASGGVGDATVSSDGKFLAYTWVDDDNYDHSTLVVLSLPELKRREIDDAAFAKPVFGALSTAPGGQALALYQESFGGIVVFDLAGGRTVWRGRALGALWLGGSEPAFAVGLAVTPPPEMDGLTGSELSLAVVRPLTGQVTVVRAAEEGVGYVPVRLLTGGTSVECLRMVNGRTAETVQIPLPR